MDRYGASAREYSRNDDSDTYHPRRTGGTSDRASARIDSTRERTTFHSGRGSTANPFATSDDEDESEYEPRQHDRGVASGNGGTRRHHRREDPVIEQLRREVREDEARQSGARFGGDYYSDDDNDDDDFFELSHRTSTVAPRGGTRTTGGVRTGNGNGNGGTHRRRRREDPVIEQLRREVREDEARLSGSRGHYSDDSEGETEFGRRLEREVRAGRRGNGVRTPPRGHLDDSEDDGMDRGRRGGFCGGRPSGF